MNRIFSQTFFFVAAALMIVPAYSTVSAQTVESPSRINISPVTFNLSANAGDTINQILKVRNDGTSTQPVTVQALDFRANGEEGQVALEEGEDSTFSLASWVSIPNASFTLRSGEERRVPFNIRVPFNAEPGGHYASVYAQIGTSTSTGQSGALVGQKVGSLILLRVAGDLNETATIDSISVRDFKTAANPFAQTEPVNFDVRIKNSGSVHIRPTGFIAINDIFGNKVADVKVNDANVLPDAVRRLESTWDGAPFLGYYTANALLQYGEGNQQMVASTSFWVLPIQFLAITGAVLLGLIFFLWFARRRLGQALAALAGR